MSPKPMTALYFSCFVAVASMTTTTTKTGSSSSSSSSSSYTTTTAFTLSGRASNQMSHNKKQNHHHNCGKNEHRCRRRRSRNYGKQRRSNDKGENFAVRVKAQQDDMKAPLPREEEEEDEEEDEESRKYEVHQGTKSRKKRRRRQQQQRQDRDIDLNSEEMLAQRRRFLHAVVTATTTTTSSTIAGTNPEMVSAIQTTYPPSLEFDDEEEEPWSRPRDLASLRSERIAARKAEARKSMDDLSSNPLALLRSPKNLLASAVWAGALWLLSGSRSNPLVTPLANVLYDAEEEDWLKDRNDGMFAPLPIGFMLLLGLVFLMLGVFADRAILALAEGDKGLTLQLAGVSLIGGGALELGRIASGEKKSTREDSDRDEMLRIEFAEFAERRLMAGGNVHRSEVTAAFRRFYAKYRVADNPDYPLSDLEVERLMRSWNLSVGNEDMSSGGFFKGIQINDKADAFAANI